jgi:hypothetical protein
MSGDEALDLILAIGGTLITAWYARYIYVTLRKGRIERLPGIEPFTPTYHPAIYWSLIGVFILTAIGIGTASVQAIIRVLQ